jgi:hypothetical protein
MNAQKILKNEVLLNLAGKEYVASVFIKISKTYKYICIFICESVVEIGLVKSTTYSYYFSCGYELNSVSSLLSISEFFNY